MIDFQNHVIPGVDDGAADVEQAEEALRELASQGVTTVVATPHLSGALSTSPAALEQALAEIDRGWAELLAVAPGVAGVTLLRGAEVMLDTPAPDLSDPRVRLAGTAFVLVEFPFMTVPPFASAALFEQKMKGWIPVLAHPERYSNLHEDLSDAEEWTRVGALLQVNSGSLLGRYGEVPRRMAWALLERGMVSYLSSDYHARGRCHVADGRAALEARGAGEQAALLMETNPQRLLDGLAPLPVAPIGAAPSLWRRLFGR
jgi:protein-tyrosine phosphatase